MVKYIFVTGGVVSSLGKGITVASIGCLLESRGLKVTLQKIDPYLNVDPGTMSPFQHGEIFVTDDGAETDLDLGHYERFTRLNLSQENNFTAGIIYQAIIERERQGGYLGKTVQVIPHVTDEIKRRIKVLGKDKELDVIITEVGGTVGDIESLPFLEAIRQFPYDLGRERCLYIHLTLVPYIKASGELKTKPTQHSVGRLRQIGIQPDIILCRVERSLPREAVDKIALFCNVKPKAVIQARDVESVYEVPLLFKKQGLDGLIVRALALRGKKQDLHQWELMVEKIKNPSRKTTIALVGKYIKLQDAYKSINEALIHGGIANECGVEIKHIDSDSIERKGTVECLRGVGGILVPGGFGDRGIEGKIEAIRYARQEGIPFLGICLGMQTAVIEFARNVCALKGANSSEFDPATPHPVITLLPEQKNISDLGGTMRLGAYPCELKQGSLVRKAYGHKMISERHRHRYEFNPRYRWQLEEAGMRVSGIYPDRQLVEIIELVDHPWFVATQFHPEFQSKPTVPHPLFRDFIASCLNRGDLRIPASLASNSH